MRSETLSGLREIQIRDRDVRILDPAFRIDQNNPGKRCLNIILVFKYMGHDF